MAKKQLGIFYVDANKAYFYGSNATSMLQVEVPADTLSYFDILNKDKFYQIIQTLVTTNKIEPVPVLILFSPSATYEKDVAAKSSEELTTESQQFLSSVPFERVLSRVYKLQDKAKIIAVNQDLYETVKHGFEKVSFSTAGVVSFLFLQGIMPEIGQSLNLEFIANKFETIKQYSMIASEDVSGTGKPNPQTAETNKPNPLRLYGLVGVFVVLLGILGFMIFTTMQPQSKPVLKQTTQAPVALATPTSVPTPTLVPTQGATTSGEIISPTAIPLRK